MMYCVHINFASEHEIQTKSDGFVSGQDLVLTCWLNVYTSVDHCAGNLLPK